MKLNIGCGEKLLEGHVNFDKTPVDASCKQGDINDVIDIPDGSADEVLLDNVIEHVDCIVHSMKDVRRLLKLGGIVKIYTPHYSSNSSWRDPTHRHHLSYFSFDMFCKSRNAHYLGGRLFEISQKKLSFGGGITMIGRLIFKISPELYEKKFCFIFPCSTLYVCLKAI